MSSARFGRSSRLSSISSFSHHRRFKKIVLILGTLLLLANSAAALAATMTIDSYPNPAVAGEKLRYHVIVRQGTGRPCTNVTIALNLPAGVTFNRSWPGGSQNGSQVRWNLSRLHNQTVDRWAEVTVDPGATIGSSLSASGSVSGSNCSTQSGTTTTPIEPGGQPALTLDKAASRSHVNAGGQFNYTINYANTGNAPATGVVISDTLPANTAFSSATGGGVHAGGTATWNLGTVNAGATGSVTLTVDVASPLANGTVLQNTASMTSAELPVVASPTVDVIVDSAPVLQVSKSASSTHASPGETLNYTILYENVGNDRANNIVIRDTLPADVTFLSASPTGSESNGLVTINAGSLDAGATAQAYVSVRVNSPLANQTVLENQVSIASNETAEVSGPQTDVTVTSAPELTLSKSASRLIVPAGEQVVYTLHYENIGSDQATNMVLEDVLPAESQFVSATGGGTFSGGQATWNLGSLGAGASGSVNLTVEVFDPIANGTILHNTASLSATELQQPATAFNNVTASSAPQLIIDKRVSSQTASPGDELIYTIRYGNAGSDTATGVTLEDHLPQDVTFVTASGGGTESGGIVDWTLPDLQPSASGSVSVTVKVNSPLANGLILHNSATIDSTEISPVSAVVANSDVTISSSPTWSFFKASTATNVIPGQQVIFFIQAQNTGTAEATGVIIEDSLPAGLTLVSTEPQSTVNGQALSWSVPNWLPADQKFFKVTAQVDSPLANGTRLENIASINSNETGSLTSSAAVTVSSAPVLEVEKAVSRNTANPGDTLDYTLTYRNTGNDQASGVVLEDHLPAEVMFVSASGGGMEKQGIVDWNLGTLAAGASGSVSLKVTVKTPLANGTVLHNAATLDSTETSPVSAATLPSNVTVSSAPNLEIVKTVSTQQASPDDTLVYTLSYKNKGTDTATGVQLEDHLPADVNFVSATGNGTESGGIVSWPIGDLAAGASGAVSLTVTVKNPLPNGTSITNPATLSSTETGPVQAEVTASTVTVSSSPAYLLSKSVSKKIANPGDTLDYTLGYSNTGTDTGTGVTLTDTLPAGVTFLSASGGGTESGGVVTWPATDLSAGASGSVNLKVQIDNPLPNGTVLTNSANLTDGTRGSIGITDTTISSAPILGISKTASRPTVRPGDELIYYVNISNTGNDAATDLVVEDHLPPEVTFVSASGGGMHSNGVVRWTADLFPAGISGPFTINVKVNSPLADGTILHNSATIDSTETTPLSSGVVDVTVESAPSYLLSKSVSKKVASPGDTLDYTLTYSNTGTDIGTGVTLTDTLPPGVTFLSASGGGTESGGVVTWPATDLQAGASGSVNLKVQIDSPLANGTVLTNSANLTDGTRGSIGITDTTISSAPILGISKTASRATVRPGEELVYYVNISNTGNDAATDVVVEDLLPPEVIFVSASGGGTHSNGVVRWTANLFPAGVSGPFTINVKVNSPLADGTILHNSATIDSSETPPLSSGVVDVTVESAPAYLLLKSVSKKNASPGDTLDYTLEYRNTGTDIGTGVTLTDTLPAGVSFLSASGGGTESGGIVTWPATDLAAGASGSVSLKVQVDNPLPNGTVLTNSANLTDGTRGSIGITDTTITSAPVLTISKMASRSTARPGDQIVYYVNIANTGTDAATGIMLEDHLPPEVTFVSASAGGIHSGGVVRWTFDRFDAGLSGPLTVTVQVNSPLANGTILHNSATIDSTETAPQSSGIVDVTVESAPAYRLDKTVSRKIASPGDTLTYSLAYSNTGTDAGLGVTLTDTLPQGVSFVSAAGGGTESGGLVTWPTADLPAGASGAVTLKVSVDSPLPNGTVLSNSANLTDGTRGAIGITDTTITSAPLLDIGKTASRPIVNAGDSLSYVIDIANTGTDVATGVSIEDHLPLEVTFVSASDGGTHANGVVTWSLGDKPAGSSGSLTVNVLVNSPLANGTILHNSATMTSNETAPVSTGTVDVTVNSAPSLGIVKSASRTTVDAGGQVSYTLDFANIGTDTATGVIVEDHLPTDVAFVSATPGGVFSNGVVDWNIGDIPAGGSGSVTLTVQANAPLANGTVLHNTASIGSNETIAVSSDLVDVTVSSAPVLSVSKSASQPVAEAGGSITYTISYGNSGTDAATGAQLEDHLPPEVTFVSATGGGTHAAGIVTWPLGTLPSGDNGSVTLTVSVNSPLADGTVLHNDVTLTSNETAPVSAPTTDVVVNSTPVLTFSKAASTASINAGAQLSYQLDYSNTGTDSATAVTITDTVPPDTTFLSASGGGSYDDASRTVTWNLGTLVANSSGVVTVTVMVNSPLADGTVLLNQASIDSNETLPVSASDSVTVLSAPVLVLTKTPNPSGFIEAGEQLNYTLELRNEGTDQAVNIVVVDQLPAGAVPVVIGGAGSFDPATGQITWSVASLQAGQVLSVQYAVQVPLDLPSGSAFTNSASASAANATPVSTQSSVQIDSRALLQLSKSGSNSVEAGTTASYVIEYFNAGNLTAANVVLKDSYPAGSSFVSASNGGIDGGGEVTWNLGNVAPLSGGTVELVLMADLGLLDNTVLVNNATASAGNATSVSASASTVVRSHVELLQTISGAPDPVQAGEQVTFTVVTENIGNEIASGVEIRANLPANTQFASATAGGTYDAVTNEVVWTPGTIAALDRFETSFVVDVNSPLTNGTQLTSVSSAVSVESQPVSAQTTVTVSSAPLLLLGKTASTGPDTPENSVLYEITIQNQGNQDATGVVITDVLPYGLLADSASDGGVIAPDYKSVRWDLGTVPAMAAPVELQLLATAFTTIGGPIVNTATASSTESPDVSASATIDPQIEPYEEIPTLDRYGLALMVLLLMGLGVFGLRRMI